MNFLVECRICRRSMKVITNTHLKKHQMNLSDYTRKFPNTQIISDKSKETHHISLLGRKFSEETRRKLSKAHKGKTLKEETKKKLSEYFRGRKLTEEHKQKLREYYKTHDNPFKGKKHSEKSKRRMREAAKGRIPWNKGKTWSEETRKKISKKLKGMKLSLETRKKMSLAQKGKTISKITKRKISKAKKGKTITLEHKRKILESINKSPNKFEKECIALFKKNNLPLKFVGDFNNKNFFIAGRVPDFVATNGKKILIEVFYEYFKIKQYGSIENYKKDRINIFSRYGWKTLFFTYKEIKSDLDVCLRRLKKELE